MVRQVCMANKKSHQRPAIYQAPSGSKLNESAALTLSHLGSELHASFHALNVHQHVSKLHVCVRHMMCVDVGKASCYLRAIECHSDETENTGCMGRMKQRWRVYIQYRWPVCIGHDNLVGF